MFVGGRVEHSVKGATTEEKAAMKEPKDVAAKTRTTRTRTARATQKVCTLLLSLTHCCGR